MRNGLIFLIFICSTSLSLAQHKCKTDKTNTGTTTVCRHQNGSASTLEEWDKDRRQGSFTAYNSEGKELCKYYLRTFAGHASVHVSYHPNGQVKKVEFRSAPDGGIQFQHETIEFDEKGAKTNFYDFSYPPKLITQPIAPKPEVRPSNDTTPSLSMVIRKLEVLELHNLSGKSVRLNYQKTPEINQPLELEKAKLVLDSLHVESFTPLSPFTGKLTILTTKRSKNNLELIYALPYFRDETRVYPVYIVRKH